MEKEENEQEEDEDVTIRITTVIYNYDKDKAFIRKLSSCLLVQKTQPLSRTNNTFNRKSPQRKTQINSNIYLFIYLDVLIL